MSSKLRVIESDHSGKAYATEARARKEVEKVGDMLEGMANARIIPTMRDGVVKYTAIFFCFTVEQDIIRVARMGFQTYR